MQNIISSPNFPRSNGLAERTIQTVKQLLVKAKQSNMDYYLALLQFRNAEKHNLASPSQLLMSRRLRTNITCSREYLKPKLVNIDEHLEKTKEYNEKIKKLYDKSAKNLGDIKNGETVLFKKEPHLSWSPATIRCKASQPRSYLVEHGTRVYRRNREHLKPLPGQQIIQEDSVIDNNNVPCNTKFSRSGKRKQKDFHFRKKINK